MKRKMVFALAIGLAVSVIGGCGQTTPQADDTTAESSLPVKEETQERGTDLPEEGTYILLSDDQILVNNAEISRSSEDAVYAANDIVFYLEGQDFTYGEGEETDEHSQAEADAHTVIYITEPGDYVLSGQLSAGQIAVDLGEDAEEDPDAVVTLYLNGVDIRCNVAPGVIFYNVYECGSSEEASAVKDVDTSGAGANVVIVDDTVNNVKGSYVARIYKSYTLNEAGTEVVDSKKLHKYDAAFYSKMSMNVDGGEKDSGVLNIYAENEGLDSELHLTINGGNIYIESGNDGINTNEDNVSVTTINDGSLHIWVTGSTGEGDGIDSNGWLVINGGEVVSGACGFSADAGIDSELGIYLNGGTVFASGNMLDRISGNEQPYVIFVSRTVLKGGSTYVVKDGNGNSVTEYSPSNDFMYLIISGAEIQEDAAYTLWCGDKQVGESMQEGMGGRGPGGFGGGFGGKGEEFPAGMDRPEGMEPPEWPEGMERPEWPEGMEHPEWPEGMEHPEWPEGMEPPEWPDGKERPEKPESAEKNS